MLTKPSVIRHYVQCSIWRMGAARGKASAAGGRSDLGSFWQRRAGEGQYRWTGRDESKCVADGDDAQLKESME